MKITLQKHSHQFKKKGVEESLVIRHQTQEKLVQLRGLNPQSQKTRLLLNLSSVDQQPPRNLKKRGKRKKKRGEAKRRHNSVAGTGRSSPFNFALVRLKPRYGNIPPAGGVCSPKVSQANRPTPIYKTNQFALYVTKRALVA